MSRNQAISIHAPRMGSDLRRTERFTCALDFNPRSPDGERRDQEMRRVMRIVISIHAPRMGSDRPSQTCSRSAVRFQSTLPGWGATRPPCRSWNPSQYFNPRSPDGERLMPWDADNRVVAFQSTLPGWGATLPTLSGCGLFHVFQSTLPGWGATLSAGRLQYPIHHFNPRSPDGERRCAEFGRGHFGAISIHAPRMGSDAVPNLDVATLALFQSTLPGWGATIRIQGGCGNRFQSTLPGWGATESKRYLPTGRSYFNPRSPDGERRLSPAPIIPG
ncbi:Hypothetical protein NRBB04_1388 [Bifidobacterium breve]|nr:Hypothetical protein NRBB04_1388 [Bifidobacterium breve]